jgi:DNA invertase Pin-like site-specific DNA recombinase
MYQKGRHKGGSGARGSGNGNAKIGPKEAEEIFSDQRPQRQIARDYGITQAAVSQIKTKKTWSHVNV